METKANNTVANTANNTVANTANIAVDKAIETANKAVAKTAEFLSAANTANNSGDYQAAEIKVANAQTVINTARATLRKVAYSDAAKHNTEYISACQSVNDTEKQIDSILRKANELRKKESAKKLAAVLKNASVQLPTFWEQRESYTKGTVTGFVPDFANSQNVLYLRFAKTTETSHTIKVCALPFTFEECTTDNIAKCLVMYAIAFANGQKLTSVDVCGDDGAPLTYTTTKNGVQTTVSATIKGKNFLTEFLRNCAEIRLRSVDGNEYSLACRSDSDTALQAKTLSFADSVLGRGDKLAELFAACKNRKQQKACIHNTAKAVIETLSIRQRVMDTVKRTALDIR